MENQPGKVTREEGSFKVVFERVFDYDILNVWEAITNPEKLKLWFIDIAMDYKPGGKLTFHHADKEKTVTYGEIVTIDPPNRFEYIWEGDLAIWELFSMGEGKCRLKLSYSKIHEDYLLKTPVGWHLLLGQLEEMLGGKRDFLPIDENSTEFNQVLSEYEKLISNVFPHLKL